MAEEGDVIRQLLEGLGNGASTATEEALKVAKQLAALSSTVKDGTVSAFDAATDAVMTVVGPAVLMGRRLSSLTQSMYGAEGAFSSTARTLTEVTDRIQKSLDMLAKLSPSTVVSGLIRAVSATLEFATNTLSFQIEASQKVADTFFSLAKVGATYSGRISGLARDSVALSLSLKDYAKMVAINLESISKFGLGVEKGSLLLAGLTTSIYYSKIANQEFSKEVNNLNSGLLMMYGSFEELSKGVSDYLVLQAQEGKNLRDMNVKELIRNGVLSEYLLRQKELSAITGKTVENLRKEEENRRRQLDYSLKVSRLGDDAKENLREGMSVVGKIFGDSGAKYAEEFFATGGKVFTQEALTFEAANAEATTAIKQMITSINATPDAYRQGYTTYLKTNADALEASARSIEDLAEVNRAANNALIKNMTEVGSGILANMTIIRGATDIIAALAQQRVDLRAGLSGESQAYVDAERERQRNQMRIDAMVVDNMSQMDTIIRALNRLQQVYIDVQDNAFKSLMATINATKEPLDNFGQVIAALVKEGLRALQGGIGPAPPAPPGMPPAPENPPQRAVGGVTAGPTLAGEAGPEAVIPLAGGSIPMRIDFNPLASILSQQVVLTNELIEVVKESVDVQERILNASY